MQSLKFLRREGDALSREELSAISGLSSSEVVRVVDSEESLLFAERAMRRRKNIDVTNQYLDTRFLVPTSNVYERLFSQVGYTLSSRRKGITPLNLESQIFLYLNGDLWSRFDVHQLIFRS